MTHFIIEVANTHGGDKLYLLELIQEFEKFKGHGMKFQPLHPDELATEDFKWYSVYKELFFDENEWSEIIDYASKSKMIWLDLFDSYGVKILEQNLLKVQGIKLQASVLYNQEVIKTLKQIDCSSLQLILNISALQLENINERLEFFTKNINPKEILLEAGFQAYPTNLEDSGLNKINVLRKNFNTPIVFADHVSSESKDAITLPLMASMIGAKYIEKHVMHSSRATKYDYYSSINCNKFEELVKLIQAYQPLLTKPFISKMEMAYLADSIQKPIAKVDKFVGQGIAIENELSFKRSGKSGLSFNEINSLIKDKYILANNVQRGNTFKREDFKKAIIGVIVAGRLKSSRLKRKAVLPIGNLPSIEKCIQSCLKLPNTTYTVLATSITNEDSELSNFTYSKQVIFHQGHPDDVIQRYLDVTDSLKIDVVIRVTADMPYVSSEITEILLKSHFETGADYTAARNFSVGTAPEIINTSSLQKVKKHFPNADYSEYMTWYFQNNQDYFKVNIVDLPENMVRGYRLTLDYQEDLDMLNAIEEYLSQNRLNGTLEELFEFLDGNPEVVKLNNHIQLKYKSDINLINTLNEVTKIK